MELNEIKKLLYKENPTAHFSSMKGGLVRYFTKLHEQIIVFVIPVSDMGEGQFDDHMDSKLLIRWIVSRTVATTGGEIVHINL